MPNTRSVSTAFQKSLALAGAAVYRETPSPAGTVTTRPANGATAANDVWQEVFQNGADTPSFILIAKAGQVVAPGAAVLVSA